MTAERLRVLVADDEPEFVSILADLVGEEGHTAIRAAGGVEACDIIERDAPDLVLTDLKMPDRSGLEVLAFSRSRAPECRIILVTAYASVETAIEAMRQGAVDYLIKPFELDELRVRIRRVAAEVRLERDNLRLRFEVKGRRERTAEGASPPFLRMTGEIRRVARGDLPVLLTGETGAGKELAARLVHDESERRGGPFLALNCGALPESLLERELFGHERGAFTGAEGASPGLVEAAAGGTLFLDEVAEMSAAVQVKFLRLLDGQTYRRLGGTRAIQPRARFIAATNREPGGLVRAGRMREDLYFRLAGAIVHVPPLRERKSDILPLAALFLGELSVRMNRPVPKLTAPATAALERYGWPGNVRELRNVIERAVLLAEGDEVGLESLRLAPPMGMGGGAEGDPRMHLPIKEARDAFERDYLAQALRRHDGNISRTAETIGLDRSNLQLRLRKLGLRENGEGEGT